MGTAPSTGAPAARRTQQGGSIGDREPLERGTPWVPPRPDVPRPVPPSPTPPGRPRRVLLLWSVVLVAAGILGLVGIGALVGLAANEEEPAAAPAPTAKIPSPTGVHADPGTFEVTLTWDASTHPGVEAYVVRRDGEDLATVRGTRFVEEGLQPRSSYTYSVAAVGGSGRESVPKLVLTSTLTASKADATLTGHFSVVLEEESHQGFERFAPDGGAEWDLAARCETGACDARWTYLEYPGLRTRLHHRGDSYRGSDSVDGIVECGSQAATSVVTVKIRISRARFLDERWVATALRGRIEEETAPQLGCASSSIVYSFTASVLPPAAESVVRVRNATCQVTGSGFIVDGDLVVTNAHVVAGGTTPLVLERGRPRQATVVAFEPRSDLAVLRVNGLVGAPLTLDLEAFEGSDGAVLGFPRNRSLTATDATLIEPSPFAGNLFNRRVRVDAYLLRTKVRPGNSGGPFVLDDGEVAGVVTRGGGRVGLAVASSELSPILDGLSPNPRPTAVGSC